jgi:uncharacterized membrane protein YkvA (DUF1232 family)
MKLYQPKSFSESKLLKKVKNVARSAGMTVIYPVMILFYLFKDQNVPISAKSIIAAALAYFIFPADSIPDLTPIIGYSDDLGILLMSISQLSKYITPEIMGKTRDKLVDWFGELKEMNKEEEALLKKLETKNEKHG